MKEWFATATVEERSIPLPGTEDMEGFCRTRNWGEGQVREIRKCPDPLAVEATNDESTTGESKTLKTAC